MVVYYFGADHTWENLQKLGFNRRNTCILKALAEESRIIQVYNVRRVSAATLLAHIKQKRKQEKVVDVLYAPLVPTWIVGSGALNKGIFRILINLQTKSHKERTLRWCYWPRAYEQMQELGLSGEIIFDADHNLIDDPNLATEKQDALIKSLEIIARQADVVVSASRSMNTWFLNKGAKKVYRLRNGVDVDRFTSASRSTTSVAKRVGYVGILSRWIDTDLLFYIINARPEYTFTLVGADFQTTLSEQIAQKPNVEWLGKQSAEKVPALMHNMKVGLSLYRKHAGMDADSMKIYEYLAAGLPVVATRYHENIADDYNGLLSIADTYDEFLEMLDQQIESTFYLQKEEVVSFLVSATWQSRVSTFINSLENHGTES